MEVKILSANMGDVVGKVKGSVKIDGRVYKFVGTAFGRFGGHNISVKLSPQARKWLKKRGYLIDDIEIAIQENIVSGNFIQSSEPPL
jgi:hypothetical protein